MIEFFRKASSSIIAKIFFLFLAVSFVFLWGGQEGLRMIGLSKDYTVATVGSKKITTQELGLEIQRTLINLRMRTGQEIPQQSVKDLGIDRQVLERMISERIIELEAENLGIGISDNYIVDFVKKQPAFQTADGKFSKDLFIRFINQLGFAFEKDYVDYAKREMIKIRVLDALSKSSKLPMVAANPLYAWNEQVRTANAVVIDPELIKVKDVATEDELRDFYGKHMRSFYAPERRGFKVIVFDVKNLKINVKESDVDVMYDVEKNKKYKDMDIKKAKKTIRDTLRKDAQADAAISLFDKVQDEFESGTSIETLAKNLSLEIKNFENVALNKADEPRSSLDTAIINLAFQIESGESSSAELDEKSGTYFKVFVQDIQPPKQLAFQEAMNDVKEAQQRSVQAQLAQELVGKIEKDITAGQSISVVASRNRLKTMIVRASRQKALPPTSVELPPMSLANLFAVGKGAITLLPYVGADERPKFLLAKLTDIKNGDPTKDKKNAAEFEKNLQAQALNDVADMYITHLRDKYKVEINNKFFKES